MFPFHVGETGCIASPLPVKPTSSQISPSARDLGHNWCFFCSLWVPMPALITCFKKNTVQIWFVSEKCIFGEGPKAISLSCPIFSIACWWVWVQGIPLQPLRVRVVEVPEETIIEEFIPVERERIVEKIVHVCDCCVFAFSFSQSLGFCCPELISIRIKIIANFHGRYLIPFPPAWSGGQIDEWSIVGCTL